MSDFLEEEEVLTKTLCGTHENPSLDFNSQYFCVAVENNNNTRVINAKNVNEPPIGA